MEGIPSMTDIVWTKPVKFATGHGHRFASGPEQALDYLSHWSGENWSGEKRRFNHHAISVCRRALAWPQSARKAREAFVAAHPDAAIPFA